MNSIKELYLKTAALISNHIHSLLSAAKHLKLADGSVFELSIVKMLTKLFIDLLTVIATMYELIRYITSFGTRFKTATY